VQLLRRAGATATDEMLEELLFAPWQADYRRRYETCREADWKPHLSRLRHRLHVRLHDLQMLAAWFEPYGETMALLPDAVETVTALAAAGYVLGLVSNVPLPGKLYRKLLQRHGLVAPFSTLQFSYEAGSRKPSPAMIRTALEALGVAPGQAVMVGDRRNATLPPGAPPESAPSGWSAPTAVARLPITPSTGSASCRVWWRAWAEWRPGWRKIPQMRPVALGVAGGSGSGKTTVAQAILQAVGAHRIAFLAQDSYYRDIDWRSEQELLAHNFDHPNALDFELFVSHLAELEAGRAIEAPLYDFVHHRRTAQTRRVEARPVILVEGILLFAEPALRALLDFKVFVDTDADVRLMRRIRRDVAERGREVTDVLRQYEQTVRPMAPRVRRAVQALGRRHRPRRGREPGGARDGGGADRAIAARRPRAGADADRGLSGLVCRRAARHQLEHLEPQRGDPPSAARRQVGSSSSTASAVRCQAL